jgi:hypothetical protein
MDVGASDSPELEEAPGGELDVLPPDEEPLEPGVTSREAPVGCGAAT